MRGIVVVLTLLAAGCSSPRSWVYSPEPRQQREPVINASLAVPAMIDRRSNDNHNYTLLYMIPLAPFGTQNYPAPEGATMHLASGMWTFKPADDLARAFAQEIDAARIFRESFTTERASTADYVLQGEIISTQYDGKLFSYCLSVFGPLLWLIGFPAGHVREQLEIRLKLTRSGSDTPVWEHVVRGTESNTSWIYVMGTDFLFDQLVKMSMPETLTSLETAMRSMSGR